MTQPPNPDFEETRAGHRSGEGTESVMHHLQAAARRLQKRKSEAPDPHVPEPGDRAVDIPLPP